MAVIDFGASPERRERTFFLGMAGFIALTIVAGFGSWALRGMVVHPVPLLVHLHGLVFLSWVAIFVAQTTLIQRNAVALHRRLGWLSLIIAVAMLVVGTLTALGSVRLGRVPPFFPNGIFLALSFLELLSFASLLTAAILLRKRSDWHRRLMLGTMFTLLGPAWGRILPMMVLGPLGGPAIMMILLVAYVGLAMAFDLRSRGKVHPAYYFAALAVIVEGIGPGPLGMSPFFTGLAASLAPH